MVTRKDTRTDRRVGVATTIQVRVETRRAIMAKKPSNETYDDYFERVLELK